ncbi:MAG TPA: GvpL/GvpF family gas vesicle protein [Gemmatimonadaceae bacterium]
MKKSAKKSTKKSPKKAAKKPARKLVEQSRDLCYVYGVVREGFDTSRAPAGLDDAPVALARSGRVGAIVSRVPESVYGASAVEENSGDVAWLSPRAMAHDRVLTWAQEHGGVIPMPMFSLWRSEEALNKSLVAQASDLSRVFERVSGADEFGLRVYRRDAALLASIDDFDPEIARLRREASAASPGQRYLLEAKVAEKGKDAVRAVAQRMAKQIFEELRAISRDALSRPLTPEAGRVPDATLVLNGAFLVDRNRLEEFRAAIGAHVRDYQSRGLAFDFTGPWPPYNFVSRGGRAALRTAGPTK